MARLFDEGMDTSVAKICVSQPICYQFIMKATQPYNSLIEASQIYLDVHGAAATNGRLRSQRVEVARKSQEAESSTRLW